MPWPDVWVRWNPLRWLLMPIGFDLSDMFLHMEAVGEIAMLASTMAFFPCLAYISERLWSDPVAWERDHASVDGLVAALRAARRRFAAEQAAVFGAVAACVLAGERGMLPKVIVVLGAAPSALVFAFRCATLAAGRALYLSVRERQLDGLASTRSAFVVPDRFFVRARFFLRKLAMFLLLTAYLPVANVLLTELKFRVICPVDAILFNDQDYVRAFEGGSAWSHGGAYNGTAKVAVGHFCEEDHHADEDHHDDAYLSMAEGARRARGTRAARLRARASPEPRARPFSPPPNNPNPKS